jgi:translocation and assembly module TamA
MRWSLLLIAPAFAFSLSYQVHFVGLNDTAALKALYDSSQLISLHDHPPASINGLRYRLAADVPILLETLRAFAYYDASITTDLEEKNGVFELYLLINPGVQYNLSSYQVYNKDCHQLAEIAHCDPFSPQQLDLQLGAPALSISIVNAELKLLTELSQCGYPLAYVDKRRVEVDMKEKIVDAASCIQEGPLSLFGPLSVFGLKNTKTEFVEGNISWKEGDIYNSRLLEETQERLLKSELFSSVYITHGDKLDSQGELPLKLRFTEAKYKQISLGAFYATVDGLGGSFAWSNRNIRGMGETVSIKGSIASSQLTKKITYVAGNVTYKKPNFLSFNQTYRAFGEVSQLNIHPYHSFIYRGANYIEKKVSEKTNFSAGLKIEHINVSKSASNGTYLVLGLPLFVNYTTADNILDATSGLSLVYSITPYQSLFFSNQHFVKQRITGTFYLPVDPYKKITLALRAQFGSIAGTKQPNVPLTKLFLGGSEDELRGYRYKTVSPLNDQNEPLGGRSAIFATVETRFRVTKTIGIVPFADFGVVSLQPFPQFDEKWFKSLGVGVRYFAFFGPLRFDIGFPLNRRKHVDHSFQIYASVGQTF